MEKEKQIKKFDKQADKYTRKRKRRAENKWRKRLCTNAKGETL